MSTAGKRPTYADIEALPEGVNGEIIGGELVVSPRPAPRHALSASGIAVHIGGPFGFDRDGPGGWTILVEPELSLDVDPDFDPIIPDLAGWRHGTMPDLPEGAQFTVVPDWVCEILSPGTAARDRKKKMPFYARCGIAHAWLVDPILRTLEVHRLENRRWSVIAVHGDDEVVRAEPFDAVELPLSSLWRTTSARRTDPPTE